MFFLPCEFEGKHASRQQASHWYGERIQLRRSDCGYSDARRNFIVAMLRDEKSSSGGYFPLSPCRSILQTSIRPRATIPSCKILPLFLFTYRRRRRTLVFSYRYGCCITKFGWQYRKLQDSSGDELCEFLSPPTLVSFHTSHKTLFVPHSRGQNLQTK